MEIESVGDSSPNLYKHSALKNCLLARETHDMTRSKIEVAHVTKKYALINEGSLALRKSICIEYLPI